MDGNDRRQRQSNPIGYAAQPQSIQPSTQYSSNSSADRHRQPPSTVHPPTSTPSAGRSTGTASYGYGYGGEGTQYVGQQMQTGTLQYPAEYAGDSHRTSQQYSPYGSNMMYGVAHQASQHQQQQSTQQSPYEPVQQYQQPRQSAAIEVLTSQFGVPQNYYVGSEAGPTSVPAAAMTPNVSTQYSGLSYTAQQSPLHRDQLGPSFLPGMAESSHSSSTGAYGQQHYSSHGSSSVDQAYAKYQTVLKQTFGQIREGKLHEAGVSLIEMSDWLLSNAEALGLVRDEQSMHADRLKLWEDFNHCWLTSLQRQKEMTEESLESGQGPRMPSTLMDYDQLENLGRELVRLCDMMEKHGLVDYQMGVWEEEIISMLTTCLDLIEDQPRASISSAAHASNLSASRRR